MEISNKMIDRAVATYSYAFPRFLSDKSSEQRYWPCLFSLQMPRNSVPSHLLQLD